MDKIMTQGAGAEISNFLKNQISIMDQNDCDEILSMIGVRDYLKEYFTVEAIDAGTITWNPTEIVQYSLNGGSWTNFSSTLSLQSGDIVRFKSSANTKYEEHKFSFSGKYIVYGNIMSLLNGDNFAVPTNNFLHKFELTTNHCFDGLFSGESTLQTAENLILPATIVTEYAYSRMFYNCTNLKKAPKLPAVFIRTGCYQSMFAACSSLEEAPDLPAVYENCSDAYSNMFSGCALISRIRCLLAEPSSTDTRYNWLNGVAANGTFIKNSNASTWSSGSNGIPTGWTIINESVL